jgi:hypothetical protein
MPAVAVPKPNWSLALVDGRGLATPWFRKWAETMRGRVGGASDKVESAHALASNAVPQGTPVVATAGLQGGGNLGGAVGLALYRWTGALATIPTAGVNPGDHAFATDARKPGEGAGAGTGAPIIWTAGAWYSMFSGAVAAS